MKKWFWVLWNTIAAVVGRQSRRGSLKRCRRILVFDTETDDLPQWDEVTHGNVALWPHVTQLAWVVLNAKGEEMERRAFDMEGDDIAEAVQCFCDTLAQCDCLVGHNIIFDIQMLEAEAMRLGVQIDWCCLPRVCTMTESTHWCRIPHLVYTFKWPRLEELYAKLFGEPLPPQPSALNNATATARCFVALRKKRVIV